MGVEIERKFLVRGEGWRGRDPGMRMRQGYLVTGPPVSVRVRIAGGRAILNLKRAVGEVTSVVRHEFEYEVPLEEGEAMLASMATGYEIDKTRHRVVHEGMTWEVDEFHGENAGLVVAEIELDSADQAFARPDWLGEDVSGDGRYLNSALSRKPYGRWKRTT